MAGAGDQSSRRIAIVGAGIAGRLLAWMLSRSDGDGSPAPAVAMNGDPSAAATRSAKGRRRHTHVTVFDSGQPDSVDTCSATAAGMIAPWTELANRDPLIGDLGQRSLVLWPAIITALEPSPSSTYATPLPSGQGGAVSGVGRVFFQQSGSLMVASPRDRAELDHFESTLNALGRAAGMRRLAAPALRELEPYLAPQFAEGLFFPDEAQVDSRGVLLALARSARAAGVEFRWDTRVTSIEASVAAGEGGGRQARVHVVDGASGGTMTMTFDHVIDCRGLGGREELGELRGVRGELMEVHAPEIALRRPVRFLHPRTSAYIVPRPHGRYLIGASVIESEDLGPISVRSVLELLTAAWTVNPAFAEARVTGFRVHCRPALDDNQPRLLIDWGGSVLRLNGLFRHGYLLAPALAEHVIDRLGLAASVGAATMGVPAANARTRAALAAITRTRGDAPEASRANEGDR